VAKAIRLKHYELEAYLKSFLLFSLLMLSLYLLSEWQNYREQYRGIERNILNEMRLFSYRPVTGDFAVSFVAQKENDTAQENKSATGKLYKSSGDPYAFFKVPGSDKFLLKVSLQAEKYQARVEALKQRILMRIYWYVPLILLVAALLAYYTLYPLKKALQMNEEFVRDILHDINTPLSALLINLNILKKRFGSDRGFARMTNSIETIQNLQSNLRSFLHGETQQRMQFHLRALMQKRIEYFRVLYPHIRFTLEIEHEVRLYTNIEAFTRIIDNLLSNAGKYNVKNGTVRIVYTRKRLQIIDTGRGIKHPDQVFKRYYKEGERGLGLGLHIVRKLAKALDISLALESRIDQGTTMTLDLERIVAEAKP